MAIREARRKMRRSANPRSCSRFSPRGGFIP
jgi:hypothetical protein